MNKIILIGNLTRDPEMRTTPNGYNVCDLTIAVRKRRGGQQQDGQQSDADFFRISTWGKNAENCSRYLAKGRRVFVSGALSARTYQANDGTTRVSLEVNADDVEFLTSRAEAEAMGSSVPANNAGVTATSSGFTAVETDELPF